MAGQELQRGLERLVDMNRLWVTFATCCLVVACQTSTTPVDDFCREAGPLLSREDFGPDPEVVVNEQMNELTELVALLPEDEQDAVLDLIEDLQEQVRAFVNGQAPDGWRSEAVVEHVGLLCDRADLTWYMVVP